MPHLMRSSTVRGWCVVQDGEAAGIDPRETRACVTGVQAYLWGRPFVDYLRTTLAGLAAGATHINSWRKFADLKTAADGYVVTRSNGVDRRLRPRRRQRRAGRDQRPRLALSPVMRVVEV